MRNRLVLALASIAVIVVAVLLWPRAEVTQTSDAPITQPAKISAAAPPENSSATVNAVSALPKLTEIKSTSDPTGTFRVDGADKLIIDEQTRLAMEALFARTAPADLLQAQQEITQELPPAAAAEASALLERYQNYSKAQRQAYPPGAAPATEESALAELDGLHALRVAHFGAEIAEGLYGAEEALTRSLIELMRLEKDEGLTLEEKAARAQQLYDTLPDLSRVQRSN
jgi:lipase chaperone LimK